MRRIETMREQPVVSGCYARSSRRRSPNNWDNIVRYLAAGWKRHGAYRVDEMLRHLVNQMWINIPEGNFPKNARQSIIDSWKRSYGLPEWTPKAKTAAVAADIGRNTFAPPPAATQPPEETDFVHDDPPRHREGVCLCSGRKG